MRPSGQLTDIDALRNTLIRVNGRTFHLGDIALIQRGYTDPPSEYMRFEQQNVLGIGITMAPSADVIALGKALDAKTAELRALAAGRIQARAGCEHAAGRGALGHDFVEAVAEAIAIVLLVMPRQPRCFAPGWWW